MPNQQVAIRFDHHENFIDFVRQYGRPEPQGVYQLLVCRPLGADGAELERYYLARADGPVPDNPHYRRESVELDADSVGCDDGLWPIVHQRRSDRLTALVGAVDDETGGTPEIVVFWVEDEAGLQRLITNNLRLRCDRLQVAAIVTADRGRAYLVKAERPSFFVVDEALADPTVTVFASLASGRLNVPYGSTHPLLDLWQGGGETTVFMHGLGPSARVRTLSEPRWGDVYGLLDFVVDGAKADEQWEGSGDQPTRFVVQLHLVPSHRPREVQLWMLAESARERLERLLRLIPDTDLSALHFTCQKAASGEAFLMVRERIVGTGRQYIDFEGVQFAPYAGYPNLLLPIDHELEPPLRKDRYREIFSLRPGELTLVWRSAQGALRIVKVQEKTFRPLPELVDYVVGTAAEALETLVARSVFTFERLQNPPRRPREQTSDAIRVAASRGQNAPADPLFGDAPVETAAVLVAPEILDVPRGPSKPEVSVQSELEQRELALETRLTRDRQTVAAWRSLARVKSELGKHDEAILSLREALWLTFAEDEDATDIARELTDQLMARPGFRLDQVEALAADCEPDAIWLYVTLGARAMRADAEASRASGELRRWLLGGTQVLERRAADLRTKDRWMLWGSMLAISGDAIAEAKIRETLLKELTRGGLAPKDTPGFVQDRIYQSRFIDDDDADAQSEAHHALHIVEAIHAELGRANDEVLTRVGTAIMAYAFERLGAHGRAVELFDQASAHYASGAGLSVIERAWIALYLGAMCELHTSGSERIWVDAFNELMHRQAASDLAKSELEVIQRSIFRRRDSESPTDFFSPDNFRTLFPQAKGYTRASKIRDELEDLVATGSFGEALARLQELGRHAAEGRLNLDPRQFAWLVGPIVQVLRRIGRVVEGVGVLRQLEAAAADSEGVSMMALYQALLRLKLAEGYVELGDETRGVAMIQNVVHDAWRSQGLQWLDHLDMLGAALESIEVTPVQRRSGPAEEVLRALFISHRHPTDSHHYRAIKLRLIDHCVEVALRKEKLSLKRYKNYLDEDEFHVRNRIVNEKLS